MSRLKIGSSARGRSRSASSYVSFGLFVAAAVIALSALIAKGGREGTMRPETITAPTVSSRENLSAGTSSQAATSDSTTAAASSTKAANATASPTRADKPADAELSEELEDSEETAAIQVVGGAKNYVRPVGGAVIKPYSMKQLVYSRTMGDWRAHAGLDLAAGKGEVVRSAAEGTVAGITEDPLFGTTVVVNQNDGMMVYYRGLNKETAVRRGENVSAGATIGTVGEIPCESADGIHLHIEVRSENQYFDPAQALGIS